MQNLSERLTRGVLISCLLAFGACGHPLEVVDSAKTVVSHTTSLKTQVDAYKKHLEQTRSDIEANLNRSERKANRDRTTVKGRIDRWDLTKNKEAARVFKIFQADDAALRKDPSAFAPTISIESAPSKGRGTKGEGVKAFDDILALKALTKKSDLKSTLKRLAKYGAAVEKERKKMNEKAAASDTGLNNGSANEALKPAPE
tara:strand:+ start:2259 stop:2861 length:603 start_codon:yes stop_codon:yes gene_type:complete